MHIVNLATIFFLSYDKSMGFCFFTPFKIIRIQKFENFNFCFGIRNSSSNDNWRNSESSTWNPESTLIESPYLDFPKVLIFFLVGYAILKDVSYLFGAKFTGRKFYRWCHSNWSKGQWVISHAARDTAYVNHFFPAWIYNYIKIQIHSGEISRPRDFVARSVAARPHALKLASLTFCKNLWEVDL